MIVGKTELHEIKAVIFRFLLAAVYVLGIFRGEDDFIYNDVIIEYPYPEILLEVHECPLVVSVRYKIGAD